MRAEPWLYPTVEIVHIAGFAVLARAVAMFDLRVFLLTLLLWLAVIACGRLLAYVQAGRIGYRKNRS